MPSARPLLPLLLCTAGLALLPAPAAAAITCSYDPDTRELAVDGSVDGAGLTVARAGLRIRVRKHSATVDCDGPDATVINTDSIDVVGPPDEPTTLDLTGGRLAPGYSAEPGGDPEIELDVDGGGGEATLVVRGTPYRDRWRAGGAGDAAGLNLNPGEPEPDADVVAVGMHHLVLRPGDGADIFDARGGAGTGEHLATDTLAYLGSGDDASYGGGSSDEAVFGEDGHDTLHDGYSASSHLDGGPGDDELVAGYGHDFLVPGAGDDTISKTDTGGPDVLAFHKATSGVRFDMQVTEAQDTGEGIDTVPGGLEVLWGSDGPDVLRGTAGHDILNGLTGGDLLEGRGGDDQLDGGGVDGGGVGPRDTAYYGDAPGPVTANLSKWGPQPTGGAGADQLIGIDNVVGSAFADSLTGTRYANRIEGGGGADVIDGGLGSDVLDGGFGVDTLTYAGRTAAVAIRLDGLRNDGADPDRDGISEPHEEADHSFGFENATGGAGPDRLFSASRVVNVLAGRGGADLLDARDGSGAADALNCGTGEGDTVRRDPADTTRDCESDVRLDGRRGRP